MSDALYPTTAAAGEAIAPSSAQVTSAPAPQSSQERMAARFAQSMEPAKPLVEDVPPEVQEVRNRVERRLYSDDMLMKSAGIEQLFEGQPDAKAQTSSWNSIAADLELSPSDASSLVSMIKSARSTPPSADTVEAWGREAVAQIKLQYGERAPAVLADARRLVARDPRVSELLQSSGLGSSPKVVQLLVERAASMRAAGRLK